MYGYFVNGKCVATNPNDMSGNTGWEEVPDGTIPEEMSETTTPEITLEARTSALEDAMLELIMGGIV